MLMSDTKVLAKTIYDIIVDFKHVISEFDLNTKASYNEATLTLAKIKNLAICHDGDK